MRTVALTLSLAVGWLIANMAIAGDARKAPPACAETETCGSAHHCGRCGCDCECEKHCKIVCEMKEIKKTVWVVHCSEFCAPLPNCGMGKCCGDCGGCEVCRAAGECRSEPTCIEDCGKKCDPCAAEEAKCFVPPKCGKVREKKTLVKKEVICKAPSYKCVVVYSCANCGAQECSGESVSPAPAKPTAPRVPAPAPAPPKTTRTAPLPPVAGASFVK